jgi:hypothetical protein
MVKQKVKLGSHDPTVVGFAFPADLLGTASSTSGMDEFDTITVGKPQQTSASLTRI